MKTFADQLHDFAVKVKERSDEAVGLIVTKLAAEVDKRSPVGDPDLWVYNRGTAESPDYVHYTAYNDPKGYVGGHFRANWQLGVGEVPDGIVDAVDQDGHSTQNKIIAAIPDDAAGRVFYLTNNLPYAQRLEHGWSSQAPSGMVGLAITMFPDVVEASVTEAKAKTS